ncbi:hypothetical protein BKA56DRAFT_602106 [Ilyonectria sp. MPI-CAGE-AT-0026]|nr:hypothetical protein BKA56DRAFT_602106 [Ilyonectria sp. MPI-CAGE-AT-0026]
MSPPPPEPEATCYLLPGLQALDSSAPEVDLDAYTWVQPTAIEDNEVMFDGKALSTWYEEERRHSVGIAATTYPRMYISGS